MVRTYVRTYVQGTRVPWSVTRTLFDAFPNQLVACFGSSGAPLFGVEERGGHGLATGRGHHRCTMASSPIYLAEAKGMGVDSAVIPGLALCVTKCKGLSDAMDAFKASMHVRLLVHAGEGMLVCPNRLSSVGCPCCLISQI
jgi:hypothetical protein